MEYIFNSKKLADLRIKSRKNGLTQLEYSEFLTYYYNVLLQNSELINSEMKDIISYLKGNYEKSPPRFLILKKPHKDPRKHYVLLFKFLTSLPPYDGRFSYIAKILKYILSKKYSNIYIKKKSTHAKVTLDSSGMTFYV